MTVTELREKLQAIEAKNLGGTQLWLESDSPRLWGVLDEVIIADIDTNDGPVGGIILMFEPQTEELVIHGWQPYME